MFATRFSLIALSAVLATISQPAWAMEADDDGITWLVEYDGSKLPDEPTGQ